MSDTSTQLDDAFSRRVGEVKALIESSERLRKSTVSFAPQEDILEENQDNNQIHIILEGEVELLKMDTFHQKHIHVDQFGPGSFLGLTSFWDERPSILCSRAVSNVTCLILTREEFNAISEEDSAFSRTLQKLFISNLSDRYRRMVNLNTKIATLTSALENERNQLRQVIDDLETTRNRLISQEKLATLGQLLAGIAHEINNPGAALQRAVENLTAHLPELFEQKGLSSLGQEGGAFLRAGVETLHLSSEEKRARMATLQAEYPKVKRSLIRRLSQLPEEVLNEMKPMLRVKDEVRLEQIVSEALAFFEVGVYLRSTKLSAERINQLVISLKKYGRTDDKNWERVDLNEGIRDTLTILNNRLKHYELKTELSAGCWVNCIAGEMNQVWTNLLVNACDATERGGNITIRSEVTNGRVVVNIVDTGTGLPEGMEKKIFETNFSTKHSKSEFGLGLGLSIAKEIVEKHDGIISAHNDAGGGACFQVELPLA